MKQSLGNSEQVEFRAGFVALVGPPNVGKSTLLNRILGRKVAIVSPKPQTTRNRILGVLHEEGCQVVFMDTPGIHRTRTSLHRSMVASAQEAFDEVDLVAVMVEAGRPDHPDMETLFSRLRRSGRPAILIINKIDTRPKEVLLPVMDSYAARYPFEALIPVSALQGDGLDLLLGEIRVRLRPGPPLFPEDMDTDQTEEFMAAEIIREKVYALVRQELPYTTAVTVDEIEERGGGRPLYISAWIHVENTSQKKILVGRGGAMVRGIGERARKDLEKRFGSRVYLDLSVRVEKNWTRDAKAMRRLGY